MRKSFAKLLGILLALCIVLTGCNLIEIDQVMQYKEDITALEKDYTTVLIDYDGGQVTLANVAYEYMYQYSYMYYVYSMYGMQLTSDNLTEIKEYVLGARMQVVAALKKAEELGIELTEEEIAECEVAGAEAYQSEYDNVYSEYATGGTDEEKELYTQYQLAASGISEEVMIFIEKASLIIEKLEEQVKADISEVTEEELAASLEVKAAEDEAEYEGANATYESAMMSADTVAYWHPAGYRTVKHILVKPEDSYLTVVTDARGTANDLQTQLDDLNAELAALLDDDSDEAAEDEQPREQSVIEADITSVTEQLAAANADLDAAKAEAIASVQDTLDEIYARIEEGEDFADLIAEYGEDDGMLNEPTASRGYYVSADSTSWDAAFQASAMLLENVGDVSEPTLGIYGVHIIRYESDVTPGAVDIETVREALTAETLEEKQTEYYDEQLAAWVEALNPVYHMDRWN